MIQNSHDEIVLRLYFNIVPAVRQCKNKGLKVAVASSADRIKVDANLAAAGLPVSM
jgi:beta-phosphoglucomutase-like phosphatase (HAD superfamily)